MHLDDDDAPRVLEYVPAGHFLHVVDDDSPGVSEKVPAGHCVHVAPVVEE